MVCARCGGELRVISVILDPAAIKTVLAHLRKQRDTGTRPPPTPASSLEAAS
jgi:hypothetical protein